MTATGPFIVRQRQPAGHEPTEDGQLGNHVPARVVYREAFATLEGRDDEPSARRAVRDLIYRAWRDGPPAVGDGEHFDDWRAQAAGFTGSCTIGPLPNGDVIEVEATTYEALYDALPRERRPGLRAGSGIDCTIWLDGSVADYRWGDLILAAWNAEYGIGIGVRA